MDEDYISWLLMVPGLSRRRAELLAGTFPSIEALRAAPVAEIAAIGGIGETLARRLKDFAETAGPGEDRQFPGDAGLYLCPECGALIGRQATRCPFCDASFEGEEPGAGEAPVGVPSTGGPRPEAPQPDSGALNLCPNCGALVGTEASKCPRCDVDLEGGEVVDAEEDILGEAETAVDLLETEGQGLFLCPECGSLVGAGADVYP